MGVCANMFVQETLFTRFRYTMSPKKIMEVSLFKSLAVIVQILYANIGDFRCNE